MLGGAVGVGGLLLKRIISSKLNLVPTAIDHLTLTSLIWDAWQSPMWTLQLDMEARLALT
jgi:hypothetical protein